MENDNLLSKFIDGIKLRLKGVEQKDKSINTKKADNKLVNIALLVLLGIGLVLASSYFKTSNTTAVISEGKEKDKVVAENNSYEINDYEAQLESKLKETLEKIDGVGRVQLMIYFESGEEQVPAVNINDSKSLTEENDTAGGKRNITQENNGRTVVITNSGDANEPLIIKKYKPTITGVCVVAEGSKERITELRIRQAVVNLFNLPENKVNVYPMNN